MKKFAIITAAVLAWAPLLVLGLAVAALSPAPRRT